MANELHVLVVDDEQIVLDSIKRHLRNDDFTLHLTLTAEEGLELVKQGQADIILTDLMMPGMDGLQFMEAVTEITPHTPMIMITGYATISTALQATRLGAFDYIAKPFTKAELRNVVKRAAELVRAAARAKEGAENGVDAGDLSKGSEQAVRSIGEHAWLMTDEENLVVIGVERRFLHAIGRIQTVYLPDEGEEIRQGAVFFQVFSSDMRSHAMLSPLSGKVVRVNQGVVESPATTLEDPYGDGWLVKIEPTKFEEERKVLGL